MTDEPIPDRDDDLTTTPKLGSDADPIATGTGDPRASDAPHPSDGSMDGGRPDGDPSALTEESGDAPKPSPDI